MKVWSCFSLAEFLLFVRLRLWGFVAQRKSERRPRHIKISTKRVETWRPYSDKLAEVSNGTPLDILKETSGHFPAVKRHILHDAQWPSPSIFVPKPEQSIIFEFIRFILMFHSHYVFLCLCKVSKSHSLSFTQTSPTSKVTTLTVTPCMPFSIRLSFRLPFSPWTESHVASCRKTKRRQNRRVTDTRVRLICVKGPQNKTVNTTGRVALNYINAVSLTGCNFTIYSLVSLDSWEFSAAN